MPNTRLQNIAEELMRLAQRLVPSSSPETISRESTTAGIKGTTASRNVEGIAALIRALCPASSGTTNAADVAALIRALSPARDALMDVSAFVKFVQSISPADEGDSRERLHSLLIALSPEAPEERISALTDVFGRGDVAASTGSETAEEQLESALLSLSLGEDHYTAPGTIDGLSSQQRQAIAVFRVLWPVAEQPKTSVKDAIRFLRELSPANRPAEEVAGLIAALSPVADKTLHSVDDAVKFIKGLCPAGNVPAGDVAQLVRALSPADDRAARRTDNVADVIRALCPSPGGDDHNSVAALIRSLCPADDPNSRPVQIADLIRRLSPANITPVEVIRTLSPTSSGG